MPDESAKHFPILRVLIDGAVVDDQLVREIVVKDNFSTPDTAAVTLTQATALGKEFPDVIDGTGFDVGASLVVKTGSMASLGGTVIFDGTITALEPEFTPGRIVMVLRAYDRSFFMKQTPKTRTFQEVTVGDIASKLFAESGISVTSPSTATTHKFLYQANETDWDFLQRLARKHNYSLLVSGSRATLEKVGRDQPEAVKLEFGAGPKSESVALLSFSPRATVAQQHKDVQVRYWDAKKAKVEVAKATASNSKMAATGITGQNLRDKGKGASLTVTGRPAESMSDARDRATALAERMADAGLEATGTAYGDPRIRAGAKVAVEGVGARFSGKYTLTSSTHVYRPGVGYRTKLQVSGRNSRDLVEMLSGGKGNGSASGGGREWAAGLVVGVVSDVKDTENLGRVRVKLPTLTDQEEGAWARLVTLQAGKDRGIVFRPELGDEVVVGFEHGDMTRPYVLGAVFNGMAKPGEKLSTAGKDEAHDGSLLIESHKKFVLNSKKEIEISTGATHKFDVGDASTQKFGKNLDMKVGGAWIMKTDKEITIEAGKLQKIVIKAGGDLEIAAGPMGQLKLSGVSVGINGKNIDISGQMAVNVKAATLNLG